MYERRYLTIAASCAVLSLCGAAPSPASAATQVWNTPGPQQWVVPDGITSATFQLYGASGGGIGGSIGGKGGRTVATIAVTPGETLNLYVGGAGPPPNMGSGGGGGATGGSPVCSNPSWPCVGGTGGGSSDVRQGGIAAANRVLVAGGGGGAGGASSGECNMVGCLTSVAGGDGGDGGTAVAGRGADGQNGVVVNPGETPTGGCGGGGGTQTAGGAAGGTTAGELCNGPTGNTAGGNTEVGGRGGDSALGAGSGGGGGGGFFGGGGGSGGGHESNNGGGGGGGGGSNYIAAGATDVTSTAGASSGDGEVIVTYGVSHTLTVTASGAGGVTSSPAGIDCGGTCTHAFDDGTAVTLTPAAAAGSTFGDWSGACSGTGSCVVTMSADQAVGATFTPNPPPPGTHSLTVTTSGPGSVVSSPAGVDCGTTCVHSYDAGTSVTLTAVAAAGSAFTGWSGACAGTGPCTVAMSTDQAVSASFTPITRRVGPPNTLITKVVVRSKTHRATFKFKGVGGIGKLHFRCSLDSRKFLPCRSPKPYRHLKPGGHTLLVKAIDSRGRADPTPATRAFSI